MKRLWLALAMLGAVTALCIAALFYQRHQTAVLLQRLDAIEEQYDAGNREQAHRLAVEFAREHSARTRLFPCFMSHADLSDSRESAVILPYTLASSADFHIELARLRESLTRLRQSEVPSLDNIL